MADVARASGLSVYHLHRIFTPIFGHSIKGYVRKRRLTEGAALLRETDRGVLDIALECQFQSQAAFTRAFRDLFGVPPGRYRAMERPWYSGLPPATLDSLDHLQHGLSHAPALRTLEHPIEVRGVGIPIPLDAEDEILGVWARARALAEDADPIVYGVGLPSHPGVPLGPDEPLVYLAGAEGATIDGPHACAIEPGPYAVFEHDGPVEQMLATIDYAWGTWLRRSGHAKSARPDFERFRLGALTPDRVTIEVWLSIE